MESVLSIHAGTTGSLCAKIPVMIHLLHFIQNWLKNMVELNVKSKITELLRENICAFMLGKDFFSVWHQNHSS